MVVMVVSDLKDDDEEDEGKAAMGKEMVAKKYITRSLTSTSINTPRERSDQRLLVDIVFALELVINLSLLHTKIFRSYIHHHLLQTNHRSVSNSI
ncbi:hypothetical protein QVD17_02489 [Tagetes erecta]|uniref:Uncharacterized protein n=1 Tax=Tagetes erecta TaxID=13708 RepID=A0AAD8LE06_TARER|nr:hypothetical protein QVD17_02489 [Tagetes erecta]